MTLAIPKPITKIPPNHRPNRKDVLLLRKEINSRALIIPSELGGGGHGHLALCMTTEEYAATNGTQPWTNPQHPGPEPVYLQANPTVKQMTTIDRKYDKDLETFKTFSATKTALVNCLIDAVPKDYLTPLEHDLLGYSKLEPIQIIKHMKDTYSTITNADIEANLAYLNTPFDTSKPIETLWTQLTKAKEFSKHFGNNDEITDAALVRAATKILEASGVFTKTIDAWNILKRTDQTLAKLKLDFNAADQRRSEQVSMKDAGYANAAKLKSAYLPTKDDTNQYPVTVPSFYCWSHGLGRNPDHTSPTCSNKIPGHKDDATMGNMMGGCNKIARQRGERSLIKFGPREKALKAAKSPKKRRRKQAEPEDTTDTEASSDTEMMDQD